MKCIIWNLASVQLEIVLVSVQDSCMVCAQCTIGSEILVEVPDGTLMRTSLAFIHLQMKLHLI